MIVNRVWLNHFGRGLVTTPNDFGTQGQTPTRRSYSTGWRGAVERLVDQATASAHLVRPPISLRPAAGRSKNCTARSDSPAHCRGAAGHAAVAWPSARLLTRPGIRSPPPATTRSTIPSGELRSQPPQCPDDQRIQRRPLMALFDGADANANGQRRLSNVRRRPQNNGHQQAAAASAWPSARRTLGRIREAHQLALGRPATGESRTGR